jgi:hypothetical protein
MDRALARGPVLNISFGYFIGRRCIGFPILFLRMGIYFFLFTLISVCVRIIVALILLTFFSYHARIFLRTFRFPCEVLEFTVNER